MKIKIIGGAKIDGSMTFISFRNGKNVLVDCGMMMEAGDRDKSKKVVIHPLPADAKVDFLLITHAHLDHSGGAVEILKRYPECIAVATPPTFEFAEMLLSDVYRKKGVENLFPEDRLMMIRQVMPYEISPGVKVIFRPAGHIRGAASIIVIIEEKGKEIKLMFSGDISRENLPTVSGYNLTQLMDTAPDILFLESTYGGMILPPREEEEERFIKAVKKVLKRNGNVLIPAFALGRTQDMVAILVRAGIPVYVDGMSMNFTEAFMSREILWGNDKVLSDHPLIHYVRDKEMRQKILRGRQKVVVASSGWNIGGKSNIYLKHWLPYWENAILYPGPFQKYAAAQLLDPSVTEIEIEEPELDHRTRNFLKKTGGVMPTITIKKKAEVAKFLLSSHDDSNGLVSYARVIAPKRIILVHGEDDAKRALKEKIERELGATKVAVANDGQEIEI